MFFTKCFRYTKLFAKSLKYTNKIDNMIVIITRNSLVKELFDSDNPFLSYREKTNEKTYLRTT